MTRNGFTVLVALFVLLAGATGAAVAADWDTETTDTSTESDVSGASNTVTADWGDAADSVYLETDGADTDNLTVEFTPAEAGVDYVAYSNASPATVDDTNGHYAFNVSYDELDSVPRDADGATYNVTIYNESDGDNVVAETEVTFSTAENASEDAYMAVTDDAGTDGAAITNLVADTTEFTADAGGFWSDFGSMVNVFSSESENDSETDIATFTGYTSVNGSDSDITVQLVNESTQEAYSNAAADAESGEWITSMTMTINGVPYKVYADETPDGHNGTAVVYDSSADQLEISLGKEHDVTRTVSMRSTGGEGYGFGTLWTEFGMFDALGQAIPLV